MDTQKDVLGVEAVQQMLGKEGWWGRCLAKLIIKVLEIDKVNVNQKKYAQYQGPDFAQKVLEAVGATYELPEGQLERIPQEGGFITVSNHHFGSIDGLILSDTIGRRRKDYKMLTTFLLSLIPNLASSFLPVNNLGGKNDARSINSIRMALQHIHEGGGLGLFPAGEVATWQKKDKRTALGGKKVIEDKPWATNIIKLIKKSGLPVIPIYFDGTNSRNFHWLGQIHPRLRTARLVHELFNKQGTHVKVYIGQPISPEEIASFEDIEKLGLYLRSRTYALEAHCREFAPKQAANTVMEPVAPAEDPALVRGEIARIADRLLFESAPYQCYLTGAEDVPHLMRELARLREIVFRGVGEGTGHPLDTDPYDAYYKHLILWHKEDQQIAGAYRIGFGDEVLARPEGRDAFYTASLFRFQEGLDAYLPKVMELGRTIVVPPYQKEVQPLKLLLSGILTAGAKHPGMEYTMGPASISNDLPDFYKSLVVYFFREHYSRPDASNLLKATHPFQPNYLRVNPEHLLCNCQNLDQLDRLLSQISDGKYRLPILLRKYGSFGAKLLEFNVDPLFCNSLDGFVLLWLGDMPDNSYRTFSRFIPEGELAQLSARVKRNQ